MKNFQNGHGSVVSLSTKFIYSLGVEASTSVEAQKETLHPDEETQASLSSLADSIGVSNVAELTAGDALKVVEKVETESTEADSNEAENILGKLEEADVNPETASELVADATEVVGPKSDKLVFSAKGTPSQIMEVTAEMASQFGGSSKTLAAQMQAMQAYDNFDTV